MGKKRLNVGILGAGRIGRVHAETLAFRLPEATPLMIADIDRETAEEVAARCGIAQVVEHHEEVLKDPRIDALRAKMFCVEDKQFTRDYHNPAKRSIATH